MNKSVGVLKFRLVFLIFSKYLLVLLHLICYYIENFSAMPPQAHRRISNKVTLLYIALYRFIVVLRNLC